MPVDVERIGEIASTVAGIYREGETALLREITSRLAAGLDATDWQQTRLAQIDRLRRAATYIATSLAAEGTQQTRAAVAAGYRSGRHDAVRELSAAHGVDGPLPDPATRAAARRATNAVQALAEDAVIRLRPAHQAIVPRAEWMYRQAILRAAARRLTGAQTWREAAQDAWAELAGKGVTCFVDVRGRQWRLHTYVEMAVRTAVMRAAVAGLVDEFRASGVRLVSVDDRPGECERCRPYEHRVLALWGPPGRQRVPHARDGGAGVDVDVVATLDQAMLAGLFHPGCRHTIRAYLPGVSMLIKQGRTADPAGAAARDRQRQIERALRYWREMQLAALTDRGGRMAAARVRAWDAEMARHIAATGLRRIRYREQIGAGVAPGADPSARTRRTSPPG